MTKAATRRSSRVSRRLTLNEPSNVVVVSGRMTPAGSARSDSHGQRAMLRSRVARGRAKRVMTQTASGGQRTEARAKGWCWTPAPATKGGARLPPPKQRVVPGSRVPADVASIALSTRAQTLVEYEDDAP